MTARLPNRLENLLLPQLPLGLKKAAENFPTGSRHYGGNNLATVVQPWVGQQMEERVDGTGFGVGGAIDDGGNAGLEDGTTAHDAGLQRDIEGAAFEPPIAEVAGGLGDGDHFGMGGGVFEHLALVVGGGDDALGLNDDCADGHFVFRQGLFGFGEGLTHEVVVHVVSCQSSVASCRES